MCLPDVFGTSSSHKFSCCQLHCAFITSTEIYELFILADLHKNLFARKIRVLLPSEQGK